MCIRDRTESQIHTNKTERMKKKINKKESLFKPKVLKDQVVKFYKKPKRMKNGLISYGVIDGPLFTRNKELK